MLPNPTCPIVRTVALMPLIIVRVIIFFGFSSNKADALESGWPEIKVSADGVYGRQGVNVLSGLKDFNVVFDNSDSNEHRNRLICAASNVDEVWWQFKKTMDRGWGSSLPSFLLIEDQKLDAGSVVRVIHDASMTSQNVLIEWNGYYRCVARRTNDGVNTYSARVRVIMPFILENGGVEPVVTTATDEQPHSLSCFTGTSKTIVPSDVHMFEDLKFDWKFSEGDNVNDYRRSITPPERIQVHPLTGTLFYAYIEASDKFNVLDGKNRLACHVGVLRQRKVRVGVYDKLTVESRNYPVKAVSVHHPPVDGNGVVLPANYPKCIAGRQCNVVVVFSGRDAVRGVVRGYAPNVAEPFVGANLSGFKFTAPDSVDDPSGLIEYRVELYDSDAQKLHQTVKVPVRLLEYPEKTHVFPLRQYFASGSEAVVRCEVENVAVDDVKFYMGNTRVQLGSPSYVSYFHQNEFRVNNIQLGQDFEVLCEAENDVGGIYINSSVRVYDGPVVQSKLAGLGFESTLKSPQIECVVTWNKNITWIEVNWWANRLGESKKISTDEDEMGVKKIVRTKSVNVIDSTLILDLKEQSMFDGSQWWCLANYKVLDDGRIRSVPPVKFVVSGSWVFWINKYWVWSIPLGIIIILLFVILGVCVWRIARKGVVKVAPQQYPEPAEQNHQATFPAGGHKIKPVKFRHRKDQAKTPRSSSKPKESKKAGSVYSSKNSHGVRISVQLSKEEPVEQPEEINDA